ncbi:MAG: zinc-dependent metalloprotease [Flavipsychrobacter sp.]
MIKQIKKTLLTLACLVLSLVANAAISEVGIVFHEFGQSKSDQFYYELVCAINKIYNEPPNDMEVYFFLQDIKRNNGIAGDPIEPVAVSTSPKVGGAINVYYVNHKDNYSGGGGRYKNDLDAVFVCWPADVITAHEIGHFLGLQHPEGGGALPLFTACMCSGGSDLDCVYDTPNVWCGNIMNQGSSSFYTLTPGQKDRLKNCLHNGRGFPWLSSSIGAFATHYSNVLLIPRLTQPQDGSIGSLEFSMPFNSTPQSLCVFNQPIAIDMIVTTQCPDGTNKHQYTYNLTAFTGSIPVNLKWGIKEIKYVYHYANGASREVTYPYNIAKFAWMGGDCAEQKFTSIFNVASNQNTFKVLNNISNSQIIIKNNGYKQMLVTDLSGRTILQTDITNGDNTIDISNLQPGNYIIKAFGEHSTTQERFSKL